jgi:hypothetical protein
MGTSSEKSLGISSVVVWLVLVMTMMMMLSSLSCVMGDVNGDEEETKYVYNKIYTELPYSSPCFRVLNDTGAVGCSGE